MRIAQPNLRERDALRTERRKGDALHAILLARSGIPTGRVCGTTSAEPPELDSTPASLRLDISRFLLLRGGCEALKQARRKAAGGSPSILELRLERSERGEPTQ